MAITEEAREKQDAQRLKDGIRICEEAIKKAEKYERLSENPDWHAFWEDLDLIIEKHEKDIRYGVSQLPDAPGQTLMNGNGTKISSKQDWADFIAQHEVQKMQLEYWKKDPVRIIALAQMAREKLPMLKEQLAKAPQETAGAATES